MSGRSVIITTLFRRHFTSIKCRFLRKELITCFLDLAEEGMCRTGVSISGPLAYEADTLSTDLPRCRMIIETLKKNILSA